MAVSITAEPGAKTISSRSWSTYTDMASARSSSGPSGTGLDPARAAIDAIHVFLAFVRASSAVTLAFNRRLFSFCSLSVSFLPFSRDSFASSRSE